MADEDPKVENSNPKAAARRGGTNTRKKPKKKPAKTKMSAAAAKFPRHSVRDALRIPRAILDQNAGRACSTKQAAEFLGMKVSGPFRTEVSSATKYGLLDRQPGGTIAPSDRAKRILRPHSERDEIEGLQEAVLAAPDISEVYKHYRGENLPDEKFLKNAVVETYGVPAEKFEEFKKIFFHTLEAAELVDRHGDKVRILDVTQEASLGETKSDRLKKLGREAQVKTGETCFVMQPFAAPLGEYYEKIYRPAIEKAGLHPVRADASIFGAGKIMDQVWRGINAASVLVAELTSRNPNVFYELGLAHALRKPVVLISANESDVPFDLQHIRVIYYDMTDPFWGSKLIDKVAENILSAIKNPEEAIFRTEAL